MTDLIPEEYFYDLPEEKIAQYPLEERDLSKLLVYRDGKITSDFFYRIDDHIPEYSLLVFNNTKVIRARLVFMKKSGARIEIFCLEPFLPAEYSAAFSSRGPVEWKCLIGNLKKWKTGILETFFIDRGREARLTAEKVSEQGEAFLVRFSWDSQDLNFGEMIDSAGHVPLPPYIKRDDESSDSVTYQTIYAMISGSVAAPTAGLHFTRQVFDRLDQKNIIRAELTLHVGAGTFQPLKSQRISEHVMHTEHFFVSRNTIESLLKNTGKIIAVGTTSVRTLESLYWLGVKLDKNTSAEPSELFIDQWYPYEGECKVPSFQALETLLEWMERTKTRVLKAATRIIIVPGYKFRIIDGMITNFHQPGSTLLLLVAAWTGSDWKKIYDFALANDFRFLSYGDSSLLLE
ncbi:MAG: S-adenosylmethionine:tRNA ribosyltransferase-isomerase [Bacteroidales bacterium]|jgi:S-adenosylmethionine:tRNA ribosyltransferase-isomerase